MSNSEEEEIERRIRESREKQGLTPTIEDPSVYARIAALLVDAKENDEEEGDAA